MAIVIPLAKEETAIVDEVLYNRGYLYFVCLIVALGGVLFGFDMVIISGALPFFVKYFHLNEAQTGWAVGCINLGAAAGALMAGKLSATIGRNGSMIRVSRIVSSSFPGIWSKPGAKARTSHGARIQPAAHNPHNTANRNPCRM